MKKIIINSVIGYVIIFLFLLLFRLYYGYSTFDSMTGNSDWQGHGYFGNENSEPSQASSKLNKASAKRIYQKDAGTNIQNISIEQKFEKVSNIRTETDKYDSASEKINKTITDFNAIIQFEQSVGLKGQRYLNLTIGVDPEKFDEMTEAMQKIGKLQAVSINKTDKTSEYKDLQANRKSLEETMNSLIALKNRSGKIDEYINLENQILTIKKQIQELGIQLGDYDEENELCTIIFSLKEVSFASYSFIRSLRISIDWTVRVYFFLTFSLLMFIGGTSLFLYVLEKLNIIKSIKDSLIKLKTKK